MKNRIGHLIIYWTIVFYQLVNNFLILLSCKINVCDIFAMVDFNFFPDFCCVASKNILIEFFWLRVYVQSILKSQSLTNDGIR